MAQKVQVLLTDDIDGSPADVTLAFALDGTDYEIDLTNARAARLHKALAPFIAAARTGKRQARQQHGRKPRLKGDAKAQVQECRAWLRAHQGQPGVRPTGTTGRIPASQMELWRQATAS